jgi:hypothetical protein
MTARKREEAVVFLNNLAELLGGGEESKEELVASLRARGLDTDAVLADFKQILEEHAPVWRKEAGIARRAALEELQHSVVSPVPSRATLVETINQIVTAMRELGAPVEAGAYYRDFREATEEDLRSLVADLQVQLESLRRPK